jgi:hypothetical protein
MPCSDAASAFAVVGLLRLNMKHTTYQPLFKEDNS